MSDDAVWLKCEGTGGWKDGWPCEQAPHTRFVRVGKLWAASELRGSMYARQDAPHVAGHRTLWMHSVCVRDTESSGRTRERADRGEGESEERAKKMTSLRKC